MSNHAVSLKVLRLSSLDTGADALLQLPSSFGTIYQSEYFTALVSLKLEQHDLTKKTEVLNPRLTLELQSPSQIQTQQKTTLKTLQAERLEPHSSQLDYIIHHQIHQLGLHSLICTVSYDQPSGIENDNNDDQLLPPRGLLPTPDHPQTLTRSFRKLFKFHALNPFLISAKIFKSMLHHHSLLPPHHHHQQQLQQLQQPREEGKEISKNQSDQILEILKKLYIIKEKENNQNSNDSKNKIDQDKLISSIKKINLFKNYSNELIVDDDDDIFFLEISIQNQALKPLTLNLKILDSQLDSKNSHQIEGIKWDVIDFSDQIHSSTNEETNPDTQGSNTNDIKEENKKIKNKTGILPGDSYQFTFQIKKKKASSNNYLDEEDNNEIKNQDNGRINPENQLKLEVNFSGMMGESGRLIMDLTPLIKTHSNRQYPQQQQHAPPVDSSPSPTSDRRIHYFNSELDINMISNKNKNKSNAFFKFEITHFPAKNSFKIGSKIKIKFQISIHSFLEDQNLIHFLIWILNSKLKKLILIFKNNNNNNDNINNEENIPKLILLNQLPLQPIKETKEEDNNYKQEYEINYKTILLPPCNSNKKMKKKDFFILDLGKISTGSSELDFLFCFPNNNSLGSVFVSI